MATKVDIQLQDATQCQPNPEQNCNSCTKGKVMEENGNDDNEEEEEEEDEAPPCIIKNAFKPSDLLGCQPSHWIDVLRNLSPKLPVQIHCEPFNIRDGPSDDALPIFRRTVNFLETVPEFASYMRHELDNGEPSPARIKLRYHIFL
jgi:hypothetical protein